MNGYPTNLAELREALSMPCDVYDTGGGCMVLEIGLPNGYSIIATDWATEEGFDVGLYADWQNNNEPIDTHTASSAEIVGFITKLINETQTA